MRLAAIPGITPVPMQSVDTTAAALTSLIVAARGMESAHDPGVALAAQDAAELAHGNGAGLVAVVTHQHADPAILVSMVVTVDVPLGPDAPADLRQFLEENAGGRDNGGIREVTESRTERGYPVVLAERLVVEGPAPGACQLQAVVLDPAGRRMAVFTLHSTTGRGWLELATVLGQLVSSVDLTQDRTLSR